MRLAELADVVTSNVPVLVEVRGGLDRFSII